MAAGGASSRVEGLRTRLIDAVPIRRLGSAALAPLIGAAVTLWLVIPTLAPGVISMVPLLGSTSPLNIFKKVLLPAPLAPITP